MKLNRVIFTLIFSISTSLFSQAKIEPMLCEGELPADLKKSLSDIINNESSNDFTKQNLLGIYEIFGSGNVVYGNKAWQMVDRIGRQILAKNKLDTNVHFYLLRSGFYNAFATDQGYIFATTSMLSQASSEDEIAFILCHELSHFLLKHNLQQHELAKEGLKALKKKLKKQKSDENKFKTLDMFLKEYYEFSRAHELQADSLGLILFRKAGYNEKNALKSIEKLQYSNPIFYNYSYRYSQLEPQADSGFYRRLNQSCNFKNNFKKISGLNIDIEEENDDEDSTGNSMSRDSLYLTHPDWNIRYDRLKGMMQGMPDIPTNQISKELLHQCMSESFLYEFRNRNFFKATAYLLLMEQKLGSSNAIQKWKGICLSSIYFAYFNHGKNVSFADGMINDSNSFMSGMIKHLITWKPNEMKQVSKYYNLMYQDTSDFNQISNFYLKKLGKKDSVALSEVRDSILLNSCNDKKYFTQIRRPFFAEVNNYLSSHKTGSLESVWEKKGSALYYNNNGNVYGEVNRELPKRYVSEKTDSIVMVAPDLYIYPSRQNKKYKNPLVHNDKKEFFSKELITWGGFNDVFYEQINFDDKVNLSTQAYNQFYLSKFIIADLAMAESNDDHCPLSILYADKIIKETKCSKLQLVQVIHNNSKSFLNIGTALYELFAFPFNSITFTDIGGIIGGINRNTVILNVMIDLKTVNLDFIAVYENSLILSYDSISASALRIQSDTKKYLINE